MTKYIYPAIGHSLSLIAMCAIITIAINVAVQGAVSSAAFFNAIGSLFDGVTK